MDQLDQDRHNNNLEEGCEDKGEVVKFVDTAAVVGNGGNCDQKCQRHGVAET